MNLAPHRIASAVIDAGRVAITADFEGEDHRIVMQPGYSAAGLLEAIAYAAGLGLEVLDPDEADAEIDEHGVTTLWLCEVAPC